MNTSYESLTLSNDFIFCKVMTTRPDLCRILLESILGKEIIELKNVDKQTSFDISPDSHGIRLDVYVKDSSKNSYDIEMQTTNTHFLPQRSRYYQSILDLGELERGANYSQLRPSYVIFICTFDPFGLGLPVYHFKNICKENKDYSLSDGTFKVFLNTTAAITNNPLLEEFYQYLSEEKITGSLSDELHKTVLFARSNSEWRREYMQNMARFMDAIIIGSEQEKENTERERRRADAAELALQESQATILALQKQLEELKSKYS